MTDKHARNPILFPRGENDEDTHGMELRDWFAGQALIGLLVANKEHRHEIQNTAYEIAERMLDARRSS